MQKTKDTQFYPLSNALLSVLFVVAFGFNLQAQEDFGATVQVVNNSLSLSETANKVGLKQFLQDKESASGLELEGYVIDYEYNFITTQALTVQTDAYHLNIFLQFPSLASNDYFLAQHTKGTDTIYGSSFQKRAFYSAKATLKSLQFVDLPPYASAAAQLKSIVLKPKQALGFGDSEPCQVNANCPEENSQPNANKAAVRILLRNGNLQGWCSGTLINNTAYDFKPYLLTAEHCAIISRFASARDLIDWVFFFNYASPNCSNPATEIGLDNDFLIGASLVARSNDNGGDFGSDFLLLELNNQVPQSFNAIYAGWNRSEINQGQGVCYHHPAGDIKKVSTYKRGATLGSFGEETPNTHWVLSWDQTTNGYGTTEGGSSGSSLLDANGQILGVLTGGSSSCSDKDLNDFYGTMAYGWTRNGSQSINQLRPWLDPLATGLLTLNGAFFGEEKPDYVNSGTLTIAPNPVINGEIRIFELATLSDVLQLQVFDISGRLIFEAEKAPLAAEPLVFKLNNYKAGLYFARLKQGNKTKTQKIWLQ
jgi:hypothetical protein